MARLCLFKSMCSAPAVRPQHTSRDVQYGRSKEMRAHHNQAFTASIECWEPVAGKLFTTYDNIYSANFNRYEMLRALNICELIPERPSVPTIGSACPLP